MEHTVQEAVSRVEANEAALAAQRQLLQRMAAHALRQDGAIDLILALVAAAVTHTIVKRVTRAAVPHTLRRPVAAVTFILGVTRVFRALQSAAQAVGVHKGAGGAAVYTAAVVEGGASLVRYTVAAAAAAPASAVCSVGEAAADLLGGWEEGD